MASENDTLPFVFRGDDMLVSDGGDGLPRIEDISLDSAFRQEVGELDGRPCLAVDAPPESEAANGTSFRNLLELSASLDGRLFRWRGRRNR